jgi:hypothetical protein
MTQRQNIPKEELFENMRNFWEQLGRQPYRAEMKPPLSKFSGGTYERRFRGWRSALKEFVAWIDAEEDGTGKENDKTPEECSRKTFSTIPLGASSISSIRGGSLQVSGLREIARD